MMNFYMTPGSCSTGIHILLEELELVFSAHVLNLPAGDTQKPAFLALNPKGTIPVLVRADGTVLTDFVAIAWWLATAYPQAKLLPERLDQQAQVLNTMNDIVSGIHLQGFTRIFTPERYMARQEDQEWVQSQGRSIVQKGFAIIAETLQAKPGYLFERFGIADAALFYVEFWASRIKEPLKNVGGEALARRICQKKGSLHIVNEHFFGKFNAARASKVIFQRFLKLDVPAACA